MLLTAEPFFHSLNILIYIRICVYVVYVDVCMNTYFSVKRCTFARMDAHMSAYGGLWLSLRDSVDHSPSSVLKKTLMLTPELLISIYLASQLAPEPPCLYLRHAGITGGHFVHRVFNGF